MTTPFIVPSTVTKEGQQLQVTYDYDKAFNDMRKYSQVRELLIQGITLKNTFKDMNEAWLASFDQNQKCLLIDQISSRMKMQLTHIYAGKLIKYMNSIVGLDIVPVSKQPTITDPGKCTWKQDCVLLQIGSNKIESHEHFFRLLMVNLFGVSEHVIDFAFNPSWVNLETYLRETYDISLGDVEDLKDEDLTIEMVNIKIAEFLTDTTKGFKLI